MVLPITTRLKTLALAVLLAAAALCTAARGERRNVILVLADDLGLSRVSCYGGAPFQTPQLDRLAAEGMRFERCYSMPLCGPSRSVLLTGKYPFRTGALGNNSSEIDPQRHPTIANALKSAGYATCAIGKLGQSAPAEDAQAPARLGFDESMLWMGRATPDRYWSPRYYRNGEVFQGAATDYGPDKTHEFLVDFMKRNRTRPFFVYYSLVHVHEPLARTPDSHDDSRLVLDMVAYMDKLMGRLASDLDRLGLRENTVILFTSDNGPANEPLGTVAGKPMLGHKGDLAEGGVREPLIISAPGLVRAGTVCADLVDFSDFYPTILELAGVRPPEGLDGRSFAKQLAGQPAQPRKWVYSQLGRDYFVADHDYKLYGDGRLVDIRRSPAEETPVSDGAAAARAARDSLRQALDQLRAGYPAPTRAPARAPAASVSRIELDKDLQSLVDAEILAEPTVWREKLQRSAECDGAEVAKLILAAAGKFESVSGLTDAVDVLRKEGVLNSPAYWNQHAAAGKTCSTANVTRLVQKLAARLQSQ